MTSRIDPNIEVYNPEFRRSINVKPYKPDIMEDLVQKTVGTYTVLSFWLIIILTILVIWHMWKDSKKPEGFTGAGSAYISGNAQDQPYFKGSERGRAINASGVPFPSMEGFRGMGAERYTIKPREGFAPSMIMADGQGSYIYDNDNKGFGKIYLNGVPLDAQGSPLSTLLVDAQGRSYYYSSTQANAFVFNASSGKWDRVPSILGGVEPTAQYLLAPNMSVNIASLGNSLTQAQLTDLSTELGCPDVSPESVTDPLNWITGQQQAIVQSSGGWEGMANGDSRLIAAMNGK